MTRQRLQTLLSSSSSAILRRTFSPNPNLPIHFASKSQSHSPSPTLSYSENHTIFFPSAGLHFLGNRTLSGKNFLCSQSAPDVDGDAAKCWSCNASAEAAPFLVCQSCRCVQPVDESIDYFQIFGLEKKYDIEDHNLEGKYKGWQKKLHPDLVHSKSEEEREYAADQSARVIDAYRTLSKSLSRAIYILKLEGVNVDEEETITELELLAEIMEIRESVEEAADSQALNQIQSEMQEKLKHWSNMFANAYHDRNFGEAVKAIRRMRYYERVNEEIVKRL